MAVQLVVNNLARHRSREVVEHLEKLLEAAKLGDFSGLAYIVKVAHRDHRAAVVGDFRRDPAAALQATFQLEKLLREDDFSNSA